MKIVFISAKYPPTVGGGGEISTHLIARGLVKLGHEVDVITEGERDEETKLDEVAIWRAPLGLTRKPLFEARVTRQMAQKLQRLISNSLNAKASTKVIHAHDFRSALVLAQLGWPQAVATVRDYAQICGTTNAVLADGSRCTCSLADVFKTTRVREARWPRNLARAWQYYHNTPWRRVMFGHLKNQIYISQAQLEETKRQQNLARINTQVIYNPVPGDYLREPSETGQRTMVLYVGRIERYKGVGRLLAAWREVARQRPNVHLKLVGEGAQKIEYEGLARRWGLQHQVSFTGFVRWERLRRIYDEAVVVVSPHVWVEPFGRTVGEALARGKIVVSADSGGPAEMIKAAQAGILFKHAIDGDLEDKLCQALDLPELTRREISQAGRTWAQKNLQEETIAGQYQSFYERMVSGVKS